MTPREGRNKCEEVVDVKDIECLAGILEARPAITVWLKSLWLLICGARGSHEGLATSGGLWLGDQESRLPMQET